MGLNSKAVIVETETFCVWCN